MRPFASLLCLSSLTNNRLFVRFFNCQIIDENSENTCKPLQMQIHPSAFSQKNFKIEDYLWWQQLLRYRTDETRQRFADESRMVTVSDREKQAILQLEGKIVQQRSSLLREQVHDIMEARTVGLQYPIFCSMKQLGKWEDLFTMCKSNLIIYNYWKPHGHSMNLLEYGLVFLEKIVKKLDDISIIQSHSSFFSDNLQKLTELGPYESAAACNSCPMIQKIELVRGQESTSKDITHTEKTFEQSIASANFLKTGDQSRIALLVLNMSLALISEATVASERYYRLWAPNIRHEATAIYQSDARNFMAKNPIAYSTLLQGMKGSDGIWMLVDKMLRTYSCSFCDIVSYIMWYAAWLRNEEFKDYVLPEVPTCIN